MIAKLQSPPVAREATGQSVVDTPFEPALDFLFRLAEAVNRVAPEGVTRDGAIYQRAVGAGMEVCVYPGIYNAILTYGLAADPCSYHTHWCYETPGQAVEAAEEWNGIDGEPDGWFCHSDTGRRRPNGDPEQEYVNF